MQEASMPRRPWMVESGPAATSLPVLIDYLFGQGSVEQVHDYP